MNLKNLEQILMNIYIKKIYYTYIYIMAKRQGSILSDRAMNNMCAEYRAIPPNKGNILFPEPLPNPEWNGVKREKYRRGAPLPVNFNTMAGNLAKFYNKRESDGVVIANLNAQYRGDIRDMGRYPAHLSVHHPPTPVGAAAPAAAAAGRAAQIRYLLGLVGAGGAAAARAAAAGAGAAAAGAGAAGIAVGGAAQRAAALAAPHVQAAGVAAGRVGLAAGVAAAGAGGDAARAAANIIELAAREGARHGQRGLLGEPGEPGPLGMPLEQFPLAQLGAAGVQPQQAQPPVQQAVLAHLQGDAALWQQQHVALGPLQQGQQQIQAAEGARNPRWSDAQGTERWGLAQAARMGASDDPNPPRDGFTSTAAHDAWYNAQVARAHGRSSAEEAAAEHQAALVRNEASQAAAGAGPAVGMPVAAALGTAEISDLEQLQYRIYGNLPGDDFEFRLSEAAIHGLSRDMHIDVGPLLAYNAGLPLPPSAAEIAAMKEAGQ